MSFSFCSSFRRINIDFKVLLQCYHRSKEKSTEPGYEYCNEKLKDPALKCWTADITAEWLFVLLMLANATKFRGRQPLPECSLTFSHCIQLNYNNNTFNNNCCVFRALIPISFLAARHPNRIQLLYHRPYYETTVEFAGVSFAVHTNACPSVRNTHSHYIKTQRNYLLKKAMNQ